MCRGVWAAPESQRGFGAVLGVEPAIEALNTEYKRGLHMMPPEPHPVYEGSVGCRHLAPRKARSNKTARACAPRRTPPMTRDSRARSAAQELKPIIPEADC